MDTPVLLLTFNRIEPVTRLIEALKSIRPSRIYLSSDGSRDNREKEAEKVEEVRSYMLKNIVWECETFTLFQKSNLGCKNAVSTAITWFFNNEESGIILEDDCIPNDTFFEFCNIMLDKYRNDKRVWHITGTNLIDDISIESDYFFSKHVHVWGWATWKDRWDKFKYKNLEISDNNLKFEIYNNWENKRFSRFILSQLSDTFSAKIDSWAYCWMATIWRNSGLSVIPKSNFITNIGNEIDATHTSKSKSELFNRKKSDLQLIDIKHPKDIIIDYTIDARIANKISGKQSIFNRLRQVINKC